MNRTPKANSLDLNAFSCAARVYAGMARFLLLLTAISLITMPLMQHIWTWDHFLQGGQDFELGTLAILTALCLVLLLDRHFEQSVGLLLAACHLFSFISAYRAWAADSRNGAISAFRSGRVPSPTPGIYNMPLQI